MKHSMYLPFMNVFPAGRLLAVALYFGLGKMSKACNKTAPSHGQKYPSNSYRVFV